MPRQTRKKKTASSSARTTRASPGKHLAAQPAGGSAGRLWRDLGMLRLALIALVLVDIAIAPAPGTVAVYSGWTMVPTLIAPVMAPILFQVLLLDALMARVMLGSASGAKRLRYRRVVITNLVVALLLLLRWLPYFVVLFGGTAN